MPLPTIAGVLRISATGAIAGGSRWSNTWHAYNGGTGAWTAASVLAFHDIFKQFYLGPNLGAGLSINSACPAGTTFNDFNYTPLDGSSGAIVHTEAGAGTNAGAPMPAEVAEVVTIRTALRGRRSRGRVFLPAMVVGAFGADGHLQPAQVAGIIAQLAAVNAALITGGAALGVASYGLSYKIDFTTPRPHRRIPSIWDPFFSQASSFTMDGLADVIRNRKS
jgi:hypothetical protein